MEDAVRTGINQNHDRGRVWPDNRAFASRAAPAPSAATPPAESKSFKRQSAADVIQVDQWNHGDVEICLTVWRFGPVQPVNRSLAEVIRRLTALEALGEAAKWRATLGATAIANGEDAVSARFTNSTPAHARFCLIGRNRSTRTHEAIARDQAQSYQALRLRNDTPASAPLRRAVRTRPRESICTCPAFCSRSNSSGVIAGAGSPPSRSSRSPMSSAEESLRRIVQIIVQIIVGISALVAHFNPLF